MTSSCRRVQEMHRTSPLTSKCTC